MIEGKAVFLLEQFLDAVVLSSGGIITGDYLLTFRDLHNVEYRDHVIARVSLWLAAYCNELRLRTDDAAFLLKLTNAGFNRVLTIVNMAARESQFSMIGLLLSGYEQYFQIILVCLRLFNHNGICCGTRDQKPFMLWWIGTAVGVHVR